jgi:hypothetical protein
LYSVVSVMLVLAACTGLDKSENVLSPTVAGPIPGVAIGMPTLLDPRDGKNIPVGSQVIDLLIQNSPTNGQRPLSYRFEVATDANFSTLLYMKEGIPPGDGNRTSLRLPDSMATSRTYYWRARAGDGANTGPFSGLAVFNIYTPIVIEKPIPMLPVNGITLAGLAPSFLIGNAPRSGPVGAIVYTIEVADSDSFGNKYAVWSVAEQPAQTKLDAPAPLPQNKLYYWRATAGGPWSNTATFRTPLVTPPTPPPGSSSCTSPKTAIGILECQRKKYSHMNADQTVAFLRASAKDINALATYGAPWGVLVKTSGANCSGYSCDILCLGNGPAQIQRDVLIDAEGSQEPVWGDPMSGGSIAVRPCEAP